MRAREAKTGEYRRMRQYISIIGLVVIGLLAVAWASVGRANASTSSPSSAQASNEQSVKSQGGQSRPGLPVPIPGLNANPPQAGSGQSSAPGKSQPANRQTGLGLGWGLSNLVGGSAQPSAGGTAVPAAPAVVASPTCAPEWSAVTTPNDPLHDTILVATTEIGPNDVWAGGYYVADSSTGSPQMPFFEHWDGSSWTVEAAALPAGGKSGVIWKISANTSGDVWAVGNYYDGTNYFELINRWNGIQWNAVAGPSPSPSTTDNELLSVAVVSTNNVWAVGFYYNGTARRTLIEQWNGSVWNQVTSPNVGTGDNELQDISVVPGSSGSDIWAVGYHIAATVQKTLALHYDGTTWSHVVTLDVGAGDNVLLGVSAVSAGDVWAVGAYIASTVTHTLAEHWNGSVWAVVSTVDPDPTAQAFERVFATASNDVWASGLTEAGGTLPTQLIEHWNGTAWSVSTHATIGYASLTYGITAGTSGDVWAVGGFVATSTSHAEALTEHYNGTSWSVVTAPDGPTNSNILYSISANSATDIWAVGISGGYVSTTYTNRAVIEHWNGAAWTLVTSSHPTTHGDQLTSVKAVAANDVWAVGGSSNATNSQTFIEHWNGTTWGQVTSPNPGGITHDNILVGVDVASASDAWAVGYYDNGTADQTLTLHWNGTVWLQVPSPSPGAYSNSLSDVTVVPGSGGSDAWAVGDFKDLSTDKLSSLLERWNGTTWSVVPSLNIGGVDNEPFRITAISANDVWAAGYTVGPAPAYLNQNLVLHWDGTSWSISPIVQVGTGNNELLGVEGTSSSDVYVVGEYINVSSQPQALMEHWNGSAWSVVPSVPSPGLGAALTEMAIISPSNMWTVGGYLPTGFADIAQNLAEHFFPCLASCTITFSDVPVGSTFYPYIHCLACLGIINGYPGGTFKPGANVTRGQLSKIVANSAGFFDAQPNQMFQDVPLGSTFQAFIGRLASRGYISGYACGGTGEQCVPPGNLPYFRPNANATRGQISKIDSNSAGFSDTPSGQQFQDVAVGSTYYVYIYRLVSRSIMSGYACGHPPAGACVAPGNLPYFVPNNNATRGQTAKIVSGTFFPDCSSPDAVKP